jgi:predicted Zn-dependent peptidase
MRARSSRALALFAALALPVLGGASRIRAQEAPAEADPFAVKIDVREHLCENGLRVLVAPRRRAPRIACAMWFRTGSVDEVPGKTGLAHICEHMMFKGSHRIGVKDFAKGEEIDRRLDEVWAKRKVLEAKHEPKDLARFRDLRGRLELLEKTQTDEAKSARSDAEAEIRKLDPDGELAKLTPLDTELEELLREERLNDKREELWDLYVQAGGTSLNAFTTEDTTNYVVTLPSNKLELFFWLESDRLTDPIFREWYPERDVVEEERRIDENQPDGPFYEGLDAVAYGPHPYGHPILGWMSDLDEATRQDAFDFYLKHYGPQNATCVLVGDVAPDEAFALADRYFGRIPARPVAPTRPPAEPTSPGEKRLIVEGDAEPRVELWYRTPPPATPERDVLDVIVSLLAGETGRLYKHLVVEKQLAVTVEASDEVKRYASRFKVAAHAKPETDLDALETALAAEVAALTSETVSAAELERAKERIAADHVHGLEDLEQTCEKLGNAAAVQGDWRRALDRTRRVRGVTADDVKRVATRVFRSDRRTTGILRRPTTDDSGDEDTPKADGEGKPPKPHRSGCRTLEHPRGGP